MAASHPSELPPHQNPDRWDQLIESVGPSAILVLISSWMGHRLGQSCTAEDIWQETLIMAWRDREQHEWRGVRPYRAWLLAIARNRIRDAAESLTAKKRGGARLTLPFSALADRDSASFGALLPERSTTPSRVAMHRERARLMAEALSVLPPEQADVVRLRLFEELQLQEVADRLGISLSTAKRRLFFGAERYRTEIRMRLASRASGGSQR